ncbi:MAG TPA: BadF/BadG/BcrA/BcrD ATPase family protein [Vicinamibacterales bacterium]|jgi:N-acetylglucosamine kinase-like BadF-type ATPase
MKYVVGIDAGGTKTVCLLADENGEVISHARAGGANLSTAGELAVEKALHQVMEDAIGDRDIVPSAICLGLAGADRPSDSQIGLGILRRIGFRARALVVNDALIALVAGAGAGPGVVLIAGTGSIVYGRNAQNRAARSGGWGHVLADEGSGYWIGRRALSAVMRQADGRGPRTALTEAVLQHWRLEKATDLVQLVYYKELALASIAAIAPMVDRAREEGDAVAACILAEAADELIQAASSVVRRLDMADTSFPFLLSGGILGGIPWLANEAARRMSVIAPGADVQRLEEPPAMGAVHLALAELGGGAKVPAYV